MDDSQSEGKVSKTYLRDAVDSVLKSQSVSIDETPARGCSIGYKKQ